MFDLYDSLAGQINAADKVDVERLRRAISALDTEGQTYVFGLVYYHFHIRHETPPALDSKVRLDLAALPAPLRLILYKFAVMHSQKMKDERARYERCPE